MEGVDLYLCGKSSSEKQLATSLVHSSELSGTCQLVLHLQFDLPKPTSFHVDSFFSSLSTSRFGRLLLWSPRLPSTHDVVSLNFSLLPIGTVCVADLQFKGRGRSTNVWESPSGCLMFSFTLQMEDGRVVPLVQYVASLAVTEAIKDLCYEYVSLLL